MESFEVVLLLLGCVLVSSIFDQVFSRLAMPLVQIALGAVVGFLIVEDPSAVISDPELFLLIFIAPLLFDESRHADKGALWKNKGHIISLAIGLVFITALVIGFVLNLIVPSIPLAAAFALGAALGPTDAAAVAAIRTMHRGCQALEEREFTLYMCWHALWQPWRSAFVALRRWMHRRDFVRRALPAALNEQ